MTTHYHVVSLDDPNHQSAGYPDSAQAEEEREHLDAIHGSRNTTVQCRSPQCELVTTSQAEELNTATDDPPAQTCRNCGGPWTPRSPSLWLCDDCFFPTI